MDVMKDEKVKQKAEDEFFQKPSKLLSNVLKDNENH